MYWESWNATEFHLWQARVKRVMDSTIEVEEHRRFRVTETGLEELPIDGTELDSLSTALVEKPLSERLGELLQFIDQRSALNHRAGRRADKKAV